MKIRISAKVEKGRKWAQKRSSRLRQRWFSGAHNNDTPTKETAGTSWSFIVKNAKTMLVWTNPGTESTIRNR
jgi:hypothetical protein